MKPAATLKELLKPPFTHYDGGVVEINHEGNCENCRFAKKYSGPYQWHPSHENMGVCTAFYDRSIGTRGSLKRLQECIEAEVNNETNIL